MKNFIFALFALLFASIMIPENQVQAQIYNPSGDILSDATFVTGNADTLVNGDSVTVTLVFSKLGEFLSIENQIDIDQFNSGTYSMEFKREKSLNDGTSYYPYKAVATQVKPTQIFTADTLFFGKFQRWVLVHKGDDTVSVTNYIKALQFPNK